MRYLFLLLFFHNSFSYAQDCPKAWMYYEWRIDLRKVTMKKYQIDIPIDKIQIDFLGAPVGVPYRYGFKLYVTPKEVVYFGKEQFALHHKAYTALQAMQSAALADGINLSINYCYRNVDEQRAIFKKVGARLAEPPGYSEHHLYTTVDFKWVNDHNKKFLWLLENAFAYGWIPSYFFRIDNRLKKEPWHWRYVGNIAANKFYCSWKEEINTHIHRIKKD